MRKPLFALFTLCGLALLPSRVAAKPILEGSFGLGWEVDPKTERLPFNVMLAPGLDLGGVVKIEIGLLANTGDVDNSKVQIDVRPMFTIEPPAFPFYLRGIIAGGDILDGPGEWTFGGAVGTRFGLSSANAFFEVGVLPRTTWNSTTPTGTTKDTTYTTVEGRFGLCFGL